MREANAFDTALQALKPSEHSVEQLIEFEQYWRPRGTLMTVCSLTLRNGFVLIGEAACASPDVFNAKLGKRFARENALNKLIPLECYALRNQLMGVMR